MLPPTRSLAIALLFLGSACSGLEQLPRDEHVVAAPISAPANVVLQNLVTEYGARDGNWGGCMSAGCVQIWSAQFGYRAGVRRGRDDLIELGEVTVKRQAADLRALAWSTLWGGDVDENAPSVVGFPSLLVSGTLGGRDFDGYLFERVLDAAVERRGTMDRRNSAGLAAVLASSAELKPDEKEERLALAREGAEASRGGGSETWRFLAWSAIARASGAEADIAAAREILAETPYRFDDHDRFVAPPDSRDEMLSRLLSLLHGLVDLTQVTGDPTLHRNALSLLDYVFSDAYLDGRFLIHDRVFGESEEVCSGCNFMALYLIDRLYGDSFVIAPLPAMPERSTAPEIEPSFDRQDPVLILSAGSGGTPGQFRSEISPVGDAGGFVFRHESEPVWIELKYTRAEMAGATMLEANVRSFFGEESSFDMMTGFDGDGVARLRIGSAPLIVHVTFTRDDSGVLSVELELFEKSPGSE